MRGWIFAALIAITFSRCHAGLRHAYLSAAGNLGMFAQLTEYTSTTGGDVWRVDSYQPSLGPQIEFGSVKGAWAAYVGFHDYSYRDEARYDRISVVPGPDSIVTRWAQSDRFLLGTRFSRKNCNVARPFIGLSLSWGWQRRSHTLKMIYPWGPMNWATHQTSKGSFGIGGDVGYIIPVTSRLQATITGRLDLINSQLSRDEFNWLWDISNNYFAAIQLGLQYRFERREKPSQ